MQIKLLDHQFNFLVNESKFLALIAGVGAGKTYTIGHYLLNRVAKYPRALHFVGANTYSQLKNSTLSGVFNVFNDLEINFSYNHSSGILEFLGGRVLCKSMENFNALRGIEVGSFILDEVRDLKLEAFEMMMGRLRDKNVGKDLQGRLVSSPAGYNWLFDYFHPNGKKKTKEFELITANSYSNTFLPEGYIESIKSQYDEKYFQQEIMGQFINITQGKVYYPFDRDKNVADLSWIKEKQGTTFIFADFNVDPLCSTVGKVFEDKLFIFDEFFLRNSDTYKAVYEWQKLYLGANIIPDSTARNRKTSGRSDLDIIRGSGFTVIDTLNPFVRDRVNNINRLLAQGRIVIDEKCRHTINDFEKVVWKDGELDQKTDPLLTHISDTVGYGAWQLFPMFPKSKNKTIQM